MISGDFLGSGAFGKVFRASPAYAAYLYNRSDRVGPHVFAVKIFHNVDTMATEIDVLSRLQDVAFVMSLKHWMCVYKFADENVRYVIDSHNPKEVPNGYTLCRENATAPKKCLDHILFASYEFRTVQELTVMMAFPCLESVLSNLNPSTTLLPLMIELMTCLSELHVRHKVAHGDIHVGNVFVHNGRIVLGDFGRCVSNPTRAQIACDVGDGLFVCIQMLFGKQISAEDRPLYTRLHEMGQELDSNTFAFTALQVAEELGQDGRAYINTKGSPTANASTSMQKGIH